MFHLIKYSVIRKVKNFSMLFWPCMFPLILGTLFYFAFGNISESDFETVQAAFVEENPGDSVFPSFLEEVSKEETLIHVETMTEKEALQKLEDQKISGIFYGTETPYLKVGKNGLAQSIMQSLLEMHSFARRAAAFLLAAVLCVCIPAAAASAATTIGGADTTLIPAEDENCLSWLFGSKDKITMPYLNIKGQGLKRNVTLDLEDCLVGITYTELGSIGSYVSASAAQQAWKAQAVAVHSYLEYHKQYGSSTNALIYTPVAQIPASARNAIRKAVQAVKDEVLVYNGSVCDAVWSASAGYNTQTGVYGTCASLDAWGTDVPYLQSVESPYEEQYHKLLRRVIGKDYTYIEYNDSRTGEPYQSADTTHKDLGGFVQYNTLVSNGRSYRYINQFVSSRYCFDFGTDASGTPCMTYYGYGHGVGMSQCGAVGYAAEEGMNYKQILQHYYTGAKIRTSTTRSGGLFGWLAGLFR